MNESQRRAFRALGIGPLWRRRAPQSQARAAASAASPDEFPSFGAPESNAAPRLFALADEEGNWMFVGEATAAVAGAGDEPLPRDAMRLLERMFVALDLRPARSTLVFDERSDAPAPQVVVALGADAAQRLLQVDAPLAALRGRVHEWRYAQQPVALVVSAHPSQLLGAAHEKAAAWADLCLARAAAARAVNACSARSAPPNRTRAGSPGGGE